MKLKIVLVTMLGVAGVASSFALANGGKHDGRRDVTGTNPTTTCQPTSVLGTASVPQTLVVTVKKAGWKNTSIAPGSVITVSVGQSGDTVDVLARGCYTSTNSTLSARGASILVAPKPHHHGWGKGHKGDGGKTTTQSVTTTSTPQVTTTLELTTTGQTTTDQTTTTHGKRK